MQEGQDIVAGLGVDIVELDRFARALERRPSLKTRLFSRAERSYCERKAKPAVHYALRFAAKTAILKTLGTGFAGIRFKDVEVAHDDKGKPYPILVGPSKQRAEELGIVELHLSLSYTHATAIASAVAITEAARPEPRKPDSPDDELARAFNELRSLVDSIPPAPDEAAHEERAQISEDDARALAEQIVAELAQAY